MDTISSALFRHVRAPIGIQNQVLHLRSPYRSLVTMLLQTNKQTKKYCLNCITFIQGVTGQRESPFIHFNQPSTSDAVLRPGGHKEATTGHWRNKTLSQRSIGGTDRGAADVRPKRRLRIRNETAYWSKRVLVPINSFRVSLDLIALWSEDKTELPEGGQCGQQQHATITALWGSCWHEWSQDSNSEINEWMCGNSIKWMSFVRLRSD